MNPPDTATRQLAARVAIPHSPHRRAGAADPTHDREDDMRLQRLSPPRLLPLAAALCAAAGIGAAHASSHREAPFIAGMPKVDATDFYMFNSYEAGRDGYVTLIANYVPLQDPYGGPNYFKLDQNALYEIHISTRGDARADVTYAFRFRNRVLDPESFLYNTGPITSLNDANFNRRQSYSVTKTVRGKGSTVLGRGLASPPCNIGPRSTPSYASLAAQAVHTLPGGTKVFAGQRADGFAVDLGSVFDLLDLRPFQNLHLIPSPAAAGVDSLQDLNVHTIALQVPIQELLGRVPADPAQASSVIGVWTSASRRMSRVVGTGGTDEHGPFVQVSRLGNPLVNEAVIPMGRKDAWNRAFPHDDVNFLSYVQHPEVAKLLPVLYPGVFPHLAGLTAARADLVAILLTGLPSGIVPGFQNFTGTTVADMLRLNVAIPPAKSPSPLGILGGDLAGYPNGRRPVDDVVTIELRAIAGATYPLVAPSYVPDAAAGLVTDGVAPPSFLGAFPYLNTPHSGFAVPAA